MASSTFSSSVRAMRLRSPPSVRALGFPLLVVFVACGGGAPAPSQVAQRNGGAAPDAVANADAGATRTPSDEGHAAPLVTTPLPADAIVRVPDSELHPHLETPAELAKLYDAKTDAVARMKALVDIDGKIRTLRTTPEKDRGPLLVTYLKSRADIEDAGDIPGLNAWGRFRDGRVLTIETHDQQHAATAAATAEPHARGAKTYTEGKNAVILDAMRYDMDGSQRYNTWANNAGYQSQLVTAAAAEPRALFASIKDETALLYVNAHGGSGYERNGVDTFSLTTSQRVYDCEGNKISGWGNGFAPADITRLAQCSDRTITAAMWAAGEVSYTYATNYDRVDDNPSHDAEWGGWHYGITHRYVRNHFTLKANSLVYLNVCQAGAARGAALRSAFLGSGASAVVAFDDDIEPRKGIRISNLFLARLLGVVNEHTDAGSPPQRPWDIDAILGEAHARGFDFTTIEGPTKVVRANVHVFRSGGSEEMLLPSIKYLDVNEAGSVRVRC